MAILMTTAYLNCTVYLYVLTLSMLPLSGIHTSLKTLTNLKVSKSLH